MRHPVFLRTSLAAATLAVAAVAAAQSSNVPFRTDAITSDEIAALKRDAASYSTQVVFAAQGSGSWLADVDVTVRSLPEREVVLQTTTEGPMLVADLPAGRYEMEATFDEVRDGARDTKRRQFSVPESGRAHMVVHFDAGNTEAPRTP